MIEDTNKETKSTEKYDSKKCLDTAAEKLLGDINREEIVQIPVDKIMVQSISAKKVL